MKILFVYPGIASIGFNCVAPGIGDGDLAAFAVPNALGYLAAVLEEAGFETDAIDLRFLKGWEDVEEQIASSNAQLVAISTLTPNVNYAIEVAKIAKAQDKTVVVGGVHATIRPEDFVKSGVFDHVVIGEGELSLLQLVQDLEAGKEREQIIQPQPPKDLNSFPIPKDFPMYADRYRSFCAFELGRGCFGKCTYCISWSEKLYGSKLKQRSIDCLLEAVKYYKEKYDFKDLTLEDVNATNRIREFIDFCERGSKLCPDVRLTISSRVDSFNEEVAKAMSLWHKAIVWFGFETTSPRMLEFLNKEVQTEQNYKAVELCRKYGLEVGVNVLTGVPTETDEDIQMTYEFVKEIKPDMMYYNVLSPFPGTPIHDYCLENQLIDPQIPWERYEVTQVIEHGIIKGVDYDRARAWQPKFLAHCKDHDPLGLGIWLEKVNDFPQALREYEKALERRPNDPKVLYYLASLLKRSNRQQEALEYFNKMGQCRPDPSIPYLYGSRHFHCGEIYLAAGDKEQAKESFRQCILIIPGHNKAKEYLRTDLH